MLHNDRVLWVIVAVAMVSTAIIGLRDASRSQAARRILGFGRLALTALACVLPLVMPVQRVGLYNVLVLSCGIMIMAWYGPLIIADRIDGRLDRGDNTSRSG